MKKIFFTFLILAITFCNSANAKKSSFDEYRFANFDGVYKEKTKLAKSEISDINRNLDNENKLNYINFEFFNFSRKEGAYIFRVKYLGKFKQIKENANKLLKNFEKSVNIKIPKITNEVLVKSNGKKYWIPVQDVLIKYMKKEVNKGDEFYIYAVYMGSKNAREIFIINEFVVDGLNMRENEKAESNFIAGVDLYNQFKYKESLEYFDSAILIKSKNPKFYLFRGSAHHGLKELYLALDDYKKANELDRYSVDSYIIQGIIHFNFGNCDKALKIIQKGIEVSKNPNANYVLMSKDEMLSMANKFIDLCKKRVEK